MILDGCWKRELKRNIVYLNLWMKLSDLFNVCVEHHINKVILYSAVIIRKMFEEEKSVENEIKNLNMKTPPLKLLKYKVTVYPFLGDKSFIIERVIPDNYDCKNIFTEEIELNKLCNQIIHSFVWVVSYEYKTHKIFGVLFASDKSKKDVLYLLEPQEFIKALKFCIDNGNI